MENFTTIFIFFYEVQMWSTGFSCSVTFFQPSAATLLWFPRQILPFKLFIYLSLPGKTVEDEEDELEDVAEKLTEIAGEIQFIPQPDTESSNEPPPGTDSGIEADCPPSPTEPGKCFTLKITDCNLIKAFSKEWKEATWMQKQVSWWKLKLLVWVYWRGIWVVNLSSYISSIFINKILL